MTKHEADKQLMKLIKTLNPEPFLRIIEKVNHHVH
jgi:hypothetical protein